MLIVGTAVKYASKEATANAALIPSDLDAGSVGIYGRDKDALTDTLIILGSTTTGKTQASAFKGKTIKICEGLGGGKFKVSEFIDLAGITEATVSAYTAPVAEKFYVGYNGTGGTAINLPVLTAGIKYTAVLKAQIINNANSEPEQWHTYEANVVTGDTESTVMTKLKAAVDAGQYGTVWFDTLISNSGSAYGLRITAKDATTHYNYSISGVLEASSTKKAYGKMGTGTAEQLLVIEKVSNSYRGDMYTLSTLDKHVVSSVEAGETYDVYTIYGVNKMVRGSFASGGQSATESNIQTTIAFLQPQDDTAGNNQVDFEDILRLFYTDLAVTIVEEAPEEEPEP